jgi:hypothetical protein
MADLNYIAEDALNQDLLAAALDYARSGLLVFPAPRGTKMSYKSARWSGGRRWGATRDEAEIRHDWTRWPQANVGIATGAESGIFVVELDTPAGHQVDGFAALAGLEAQHGPLLLTRMARSPSGSVHYYWVYPPGWIIRNDTGRRLGPGIDVRGDGGMVIAPPSKRDDGQYVWLNEENIANAPHWLLRLVVDRPRPPRQASVTRTNGSMPPGLVETLLATIDPDVGYLTWFALGCACFTELGDEAGERAWSEWSSTGCKYKPREITRMWRGIVAHDGYNYSIATINHFADLNAVDAKLFGALRQANFNSCAFGGWSS